MTDSSQLSNKAGLTGHLKELLKDISPFIDHASEDQKRRLLSLLEDLRRNDRRKYPRKPHSSAVTYATLDRVFKSFVQNIGTGGVFIETSEPLFPEEAITLTFSFPNQQQPVTLTVKIVWTVEDRGVGVKFTTANHNLEAIIESL
jgi:Tfp pilus assembly protein PilZ